MADVIIGSDSVFSPAQTVYYPYKITYSTRTGLFGGWFVYWSTTETTQSGSVRFTKHFYPPPSPPGTFDPDEESGPYPHPTAVSEGLTKVAALLTKLGTSEADVGGISYTVQALNPDGFGAYEPLDLDVTDEDHFPGTPGTP